MKKFVALLCCACALCMVLVGCVGEATTWVGTWDLNEMESDGEVTSSEDIETLKSLGLDVYLELNEDGTSSLVLFGESMDGTWEASSATAATIAMEDQVVDMTIEGETLKMTQDGSTLSFVKGEARSGSAASTD